MAKQIPFYTPTINQKQKTLITEVLESQEKTDMAERLEEAMCELTNASYAVSTCNATAAMHLALCALELKRGDKILCAVNAFPTTAEVVRHFDAEPVFIDIKEHEQNMDLDALEIYLEANNSKKLKAVIVSHMAGIQIDLNRLYNIASIYDVKVIEDASYALGLEYAGDKIGSTGADVTVFAFNAYSKDEPGSGGVIVCEDEELYERAMLLRNHAITQEEEENLAYIYDITDIGYKYDISELDAAYCLGSLDGLAKRNERSKAIAGIYFERLSGVNHITLPAKTDDVYNLFIVKIDKNRDSFARDLLSKGIETSLHHIPLHLLSYYKQKYELRVNAYPRALQNYQQILSLPTYESMSDTDVNYVCDTIIELAKNRV